VPLIVEDGTGVVGANSFASLSQVSDFATLRGVDLSAVSDDTLTAYLVRGTDYLKTFSFVGEQANAFGYLPWPRAGVYFGDYELPHTTVPTGIVSALCQLCIEQHNGVVLFASGTGPAVKSEKIGPIETVYATPMGASNALRASMPSVMAFLKPYLTNLGVRVGRA
jgi:hypothetical protein